MGSISVDELENLNLPMSAPKQISVDSADSLGHSDPYTYTPPPEPVAPEKGIGEKMARGVGKAVGSFPIFIGKALQYLGDQPSPKGIDPSVTASIDSIGNRMTLLGNEMVEKHTKEMAELYPEKPDFWNSLGGALPMVGGIAIGTLLGAPVVAGTLLTAGATAGVKFDAYSELRKKGVPIGMADLMSDVPAGVTGVAMATGFGMFWRASGLVLTQFVKGAVNGAVSGIAQSALTGEVTHAMGINDAKLVDRLTEYATSGAIWAVLGGPLGAHHALDMQSKIQTSFIERGMTPAEAKIKTKEIMTGVVAKVLDTTEKMVGKTAQDEGRLKLNPEVKPVVEDYINFKIGDKKIEVIKNPSDSDLAYLNEQFNEKYPHSPAGEPKTRSAYDANGDKYVWSSDVLHSDVANYFHNKLKIDIDQNAALAGFLPKPPEPTKFSLKGEEYPLSTLDKVKTQIESTEAPKKVYDEITGEWSSEKSNLPQWAVEAKVSKQEMLDTYSALESGKKLSAKQEKIAQLMLDNAEVPAASEVKPIEPKPVASEGMTPEEKTSFDLVYKLKTESDNSATPIRDRLYSTAKKAWGEFIDKIVPISTRLDQISSRLKHGLGMFEHKKGLRSYEDHVASKPFQLKFKELKNIDARGQSDLDFALKNNNQKAVDAIVKKYGMEKEYQAVQKTLADIYKRAKEVELELGYKEDYFPRVVDDAEGLMNHLAGTELGSSLEQAIKLQETARGHSMSMEEKARFADDFIHRQISSAERTPKAGGTKERTVDIVTPEMDRFYKSSSEALSNYIDNMNTAIETRRFFGKEAATVEKSIGGYVQKLVEEGMINKDQIEEVTKYINARFNQKGMSSPMSTVKNLGYLSTMNSFVNTLTQLNDIAVVMYRNGILRTGKAIFSKGLTREEVGIHDIASEFTTNDSLTAKAVSAQFKLIGFEKLDRIGKEAAINAGIDRLSERAVSQGDKLLPELEIIFGEEAPQVLKDLQKRTLSDNVKYLAFAEVSALQPISMAEMPVGYLTGGNSRIMYMLKTYTLKLLDVYHNDVIRQMKTDPVKGAQNFAKLTAALVTAGVTTDWLKDFILGKTGELSDYVINNVIKIVGLNKYTIDNSRREGLVKSFVTGLLPPVPFVDEVWGDVTQDKDLKDWKTWSKLPYVGTFYYWWMGGGVDKK